ncbi:hypothetical protein D3C81_2174240 [compost metagenome]
MKLPVHWQSLQKREGALSCVIFKFTFLIEALDESLQLQVHAVAIPRTSFEQLKHGEKVSGKQVLKLCVDTADRIVQG